MDNRVYHGSTIQNLKELNPKESTQNGSYVYATPFEEVAVIFSMRPGTFLLNISKEKTEDNKTIFSICERRPGIIDEYGNIPVSIYELDGNDFKNFTEYNWGNAEVRAEGSKKIIKENKVENAKDKLLELEKEGKIKIYMYPNKSEHLAEDDSDLVQAAFKLYLMGGKKEARLNKFKELYPEWIHVTDVILEKIKTYKDDELSDFIDNMYDRKNKSLNNDLIEIKKENLWKK